MIIYNYRWNTIHSFSDKHNNNFILMCTYKSSYGPWFMNTTVHLGEWLANNKQKLVISRVVAWYIPWMHINKSGNQWIIIVLYVKAYISHVGSNLCITVTMRAEFWLKEKYTTHYKHLCKCVKRPWLKRYVNINVLELFIIYRPVGWGDSGGSDEPPSGWRGPAGLQVWGTRRRSTCICLGLASCGHRINRRLETTAGGSRSALCCRSSCAHACA